MLTPADLTLLQQDRAALLGRITATLQADPRIVAAWLTGSLGAGSADSLSDIDLWAVVADADCAQVCASRQEYCAQIGAPLLILDGPQNAPAGGAALLALYPATLGVLQVDWYWVPQSQALLPPDAQMIFARGEIPPAAPAPARAAAQIGARLTQQTTFFWAMLPIVAKYIVRENPWKVLELLRLIDWTHEEVKALVGARATAPTFKDMPPGAPPVDAQSQIAHVRQLAAAMEALGPQIVACGGTVPTAAIPPIYRTLELAQPER